MIRRDTMRLWASKNLQPLVFLGSYFITIVLGNLIYATPWGESFLQASGLSIEPLLFKSSFSAGYWILLFLPFVVTPVVVLATRKLFSAPIGFVAKYIDDVSPFVYVICVAVLYGYVAYRFWQADIGTLFSTGSDTVSSVEARFEILGRIGYSTLVVLQSFLLFFAVYAVIRSLRDRELFWILVAAFNFVAMSTLLILLNMKWPVLLFYIGVVLVIFVYSSRWAYLKTAIGVVLLVCAFLLISAFVYRLAPSATTAAIPPRPVEQTEQLAQSAQTVQEIDGNQPAIVVPPVVQTPAEQDLPSEANSHQDQVAEQIAATSEAAASYAPMIATSAINRMAVIYPYYYHIFSTEGAVCGGVLDQLQFGRACRPSTFVYSRIFGSDGFEGRGTSPSSVHVSGFALGGWPTAFMMLIGASVILGLFSSLPLDGSVVVRTLVIVGALAGYHMSQLPLEGVLIFDHGLIWTAVVVLFIVLVGWSRRLLVKARMAGS